MIIPGAAATGPVFLLKDVIHQAHLHPAEHSFPSPRVRLSHTPACQTKPSERPTEYKGNPVMKNAAFEFIPFPTGNFRPSHPWNKIKPLRDAVAYYTPIASAFCVKDFIKVDGKIVKLTWAAWQRTDKSQREARTSKSQKSTYNTRAGSAMTVDQSCD
ncbi:uncharacterized protein CLUP02_14232 [Colletotrichum lupini]|uniref:Uncharacterized protein n=1 Tax=Colletotrichum lupini TaxID=145971 RepID=A0A9Q8T404_9PEZI|nr:uncharacterized protein CLUP02_14232 [Colletotrichum lupini]UQC88707.1 hypothetical protein CLUP02_14232 [Colletotrichum lupini]